MASSPRFEIVALAETMPPEAALAFHRANVEQLERLCAGDGATTPNPHRMAAMQARARAIVAELDYITESRRAGDIELPAELLVQLISIRARAEELVDTFAWGAEAPWELASLADAETAG